VTKGVFMDKYKSYTVPEVLAIVGEPSDKRTGKENACLKSLSSEKTLLENAESVIRQDLGTTVDARKFSSCMNKP
jgi:hypothetical protein